MKIGILTSGNDMLSLFKILNKYDHEYVVWYDDLHFSWGDKDLDFVLDRVSQGIKYLKDKGVEFFVVPPIVELALHQTDGSENILPVFTNYLKDYCFKYSLVGKIGFLGDYIDIQNGQELLVRFAKNYELTNNQKAIKKFNFPFIWRSKDVRNWKYLLDGFSWSNLLVNTFVKFDLRYFKDASVDTLIPMNYIYFNVQKTIKNFLNLKKIKFYDLSVLEQSFVGIFANQNSSQYSVDVYCTGHGDFLTSSKRLVWLLDRGKSGKLKINKVN